MQNTKYGFQVIAEDSSVLEEAFDEFDSKLVALRALKKAMRKHAATGYGCLKTYGGGMVMFDDIPKD